MTDGAIIYMNREGIITGVLSIPPGISILHRGFQHFRIWNRQWSWRLKSLRKWLNLRKGIYTMDFTPLEKSEDNGNDKTFNKPAQSDREQNSLTGLLLLKGCRNCLRIFFWKSIKPKEKRARKAGISLIWESAIRICLLPNLSLTRCLKRQMTRPIIVTRWTRECRFYARRFLNGIRADSMCLWSRKRKFFRLSALKKEIAHFSPGFYQSRGLRVSSGSLLSAV